MIEFCDSHIEFIHHKRDLTDPKLLNFVKSQVNPEMINKFKSALFFVAVYVEPGAGAYSKAIEVLNSYHREISKNNWNLVLDKGDIKPNRINVILHLEDLFCIGRDIGRIDELFLLGIRSIGLTHNKKNQFSSGALEGNGGLTKLGKKAVEKILSRNIILDLAHLSEKSFFEICEGYKIIPFISHCGIRALFNNPRNISDRILDYIKKSGGYIGIGCAGSFLSAKQATVKDYLAQVDYAKNRCGESRVGIGSDFGGIISSVPTGIENISKLPGVVQCCGFIDRGSSSLESFLSSIGY